MFVETDSTRVTTDQGVATLWLDFSGRPVNALNTARLAEFGRSFDAVCRDTSIDVLVIRSARPAGFCGGYEPIGLSTLANDTDAAAFSNSGQGLFNRLAEADVVTVAFIEGPCLGAGWEMALACDYRLAVAGPDSWIGFPNAPQLPPCWGGPGRLGKALKLFESGQILTAKECRRHGILDDAFSARRAKVELQNWTDRVQARMRKRSCVISADSHATERIAFRDAVRNQGHRIIPRNPSVFGTSTNNPSDVVELAIRGNSVVSECSNADVLSFLEVALRRGRVTPLEAEQARKRITFKTIQAIICSDTENESILSLKTDFPTVARAA